MRCDDARDGVQAMKQKGYRIVLDGDDLTTNEVSYWLQGGGKVQQQRVLQDHEGEAPEPDSDVGLATDYPYSTGLVAGRIVLDMARVPAHRGQAYRDRGMGWWC